MQLSKRFYHTVLPYFISAILGVRILAVLGSSPFVENLSRFTALDYAIVRRDAGLIRRLERYGYFSRYLKVRIRRKFGLSKSWEPKWVSIVPRYGCPLKQDDRQIIRRVLMIYNDARSYEPMCKVFLDGANAREVVGNTGQPQALLTLHPQHSQPKSVHSARGSTGGWMLNFMSFEPSNDHLPNFIQVVNVQYEVPVNELGTAAEDSHHHHHHHQFEATPPPLHDRQGSLQGRQSCPPESVLRERSALPEFAESEAEEDISTLASAPPLPPELSEHNVENPVIENPTHFEALGQDSMNLDDDDNLCVICLAQPKTCGFVHGDRSV